MLKEKLILASQSPRRAEILTTVGWEFEAIAANIDETRFPSEEALTYVTRLAQAKAETVAKQIRSGVLVLGADTVVVIDEEILGQPRNDDDARRMLSLLSGKWHQVVTGIALVRKGDVSSQIKVDQETTRVLFAELAREQIDWYVSTREPQGKAGAYAIQGKGALLIKEIQGDYFNVVGLPIRLVYELWRTQWSVASGQ
ncbi:MAG TPA: Maf family protein [Pyrinomonadaceae bacterium]|nr:Maf family protein [Pyrinomonadaceae bacterium]